MWTSSGCRTCKRLHSLYQVLRAARDKRGAIDFETVETRIIFDEQRKIESIVPVVRNDAHKLIEECMLCANVATASFFEANELPMLYRVHEGPTEEKLENLRKFPRGTGPGSGRWRQAHARALPAIAAADRRARGCPRHPDHAAALPAPGGLPAGKRRPLRSALRAYAHFTSPIRRYPDLLVHRGIRT